MQINRLFEIIYILLDKEKVSASELAQRFEVSTRTIYRDVDTLSSAGIPIYATKGKGGGISLLPEFVLNKTVLTESEKTEILSSLNAITAVNPTDANTALSKLSSLFGSHNPDWLEVDFSMWYNADQEAEIFNALKSAIIAKQVVTFNYSSSKGEDTVREIEPLRLCFRGMSRYLYGYCAMRSDFRFFKLSRIKSLAVTDKTFTRTLTNPVLTKLYITDDEYIELKLKLSGKLAYRVYDEFSEYEKESDGSFIGVMKYPKDIDSIFAYVATFGADCEVLSPVWVRDALKNKYEEILKKYL